MSRSSKLVLFTALLLSACSTTYFKRAAIDVSTGNDTGPRGDKATIHPAVLEYVLASDRSPIVPYYAVILDYLEHGHPVSALAKSSYDRAKANVRLLKPHATELAGAGKATAKVYARALARLIAEACNKSLGASGYARIHWGNQLKSDGKRLGLGMSPTYITLHKGQNEIRLHAAPATATLTKLQEHRWNVSGVAGAWNPAASLTHEAVAKAIKAR